MITKENGYRFKLLAPYLYVVFMGSERSVIITGAMSLLISFRKILTQFLAHRALSSLPKRACVLVTIILKVGYTLWYSVY